MTVKEMAALIGTTGEYNVAADMYVNVRIEDVRLTYGKMQVQITPVDGRGTVWVHAENVKAL
jgi:hypothetical protein